ncbi:MAG: Rrf2 family transcriptional regulator [Candidatus Cloacimonetes bacterium]|nr:Rrf2 family transcriptional regulator [Candidatus Cloacimonadota bacterium]
MTQLINISEAVSIAYHGIAVIADNAPQRMNISTISDILKVSQPHLAKVFQILTKHGVLDSSRGPKGGFILRLDPKDITFLMIYEIIEAKITISECPLGRNNCPFRNCIFDKKLTHLSRKIYKTFGEITLSEFLKDVDYRED